MVVKELSIGYPSRVVASGVNLELEKGKLTCLIGENGVGKSTLLRTLAGFQKPLGGRIEIPDSRTSGHPDIRTSENPDIRKSENPAIQLSALSPKDISKLIAVVLTEKPELQNTTVRELVAMGRMPYTGFFGRLSAEDNRIVEECLRTVGIETSDSQASERPGFRNSSLQDSRKVSSLSDGERQKAMIARALAQQTEYIFLDEPTAFLDYPSKVRVMEMLKELARKRGKTIFLSTHDVEIALDVADTLVMMERTSTPEDSPTASFSRSFHDRVIVKTGKPKTKYHEKIPSFTADDLLIER